MGEEKRVVEGGFRSTLALLLSIIALVVSILAYNRIDSEKDLKAQLKDIQAKMEKMKQETSATLDNVRQETADTLEKLGQAIKK